MKKRVVRCATAAALVAALALAPAALAAPGVGGPVGWWVAIWSWVGGLGKEGLGGAWNGQNFVGEGVGAGVARKGEPSLTEKAGCIMDPDGLAVPTCPTGVFAPEGWGMGPEG